MTESKLGAMRGCPDDLHALRDLATRFRLDRRFEAWLRELREALDA